MADLLAPKRATTRVGAERVSNMVGPTPPHTLSGLPGGRSDVLQTRQRRGAASGGWNPRPLPFGQPVSSWSRHTKHSEPGIRTPGLCYTEHQIARDIGTVRPDHPVYYNRPDLPA